MTTPNPRHPNPKPSALLQALVDFDTNCKPEHHPAAVLELLSRIAHRIEPVVAVSWARSNGRGLDWLLTILRDPANNGADDVVEVSANTDAFDSLAWEPDSWLSHDPMEHTDFVSGGALGTPAPTFAVHVAMRTYGVFRGVVSFWFASRPTALPTIEHVLFSIAQKFGLQLALREERRFAAISGQTMRELARLCDQALVGLDEAGTVMLWNAAAAHIYQYSGKEAMGKPFSLLFPGDDPEADAAMQRLVSGEAVRNVRLIQLRADGTEFPARVSLSPILSADATGLRYLAVVSDETQRENDRRNLRFFYHCMRNIGEALLLTDLSGTILFVNQALANLAEKSPSELVGRRLSAWESAWNRTQLDAMHIRQTVLESGTWSGELPIALEGTPQRLYAIQCSLIRDDDHMPWAVAVLARDVTEVREAQRLLGENLRRINALHIAGRDLAAKVRLADVCRVLGQHVFSNTEAAAFGVLMVEDPAAQPRILFQTESTRSAESSTLDLTATPEPTAPALQAIVDALRRGAVPEREHATTSQGWVYGDRAHPGRAAHYQPVLIGDRLMSVLCVVTDRVGGFLPEHLDFLSAISPMAAVALQEARAFQELDERKAIWENTLDSVGDLIILTDAADTIRWVNRSASSALFSLSQSWFGRPLSEYPFLADLPRFSSLRDRFAEQVTTLTDRATGLRYRAVSRLMYSEFSNGSSLVHALQPQPVDTWQLKHTGRSAARTSLAEAFARLADTLEAAPLHATESHPQTPGAGRDLVPRLRAFGRWQQAPPEFTPLGQALDSAIASLQGEGFTHRVKSRTEQREAEVYCNPQALENALLELLRNAAQSSEPTMPISVSVRMDQGTVAEAGLAPQLVACIRIADQGHGLPAPAEELFRPFAPAARASGRFGLGLALARSIAESVGGTLRLESSRDSVGTVAALRLPARVPAAPPSLNPASPLALTVPRQSPAWKIILLEDERIISEAAAARLQGLGHEVQQFDLGRSLLAAPPELLANATVFIVDLRLPDMDGFEVLCTARTRRPSLPLVITSGLTPPDDVRELFDADSVFLAKPYRISDLVDAVQEAIRRAPSR